MSNRLDAPATEIPDYELAMFFDPRNNVPYAPPSSYEGPQPMPFESWGELPCPEEAPDAD